MVRALLLAAGMGSRLKPLTDHWPKCLMPIGKRPLLEYWLYTLNNFGISDVLINTHFHAEQVIAFLSSKKFPNHINYVHEPKLFGTAGTLRNNLSFFDGHTALLIHADNWCQCNFSEFINYHLHYRPKHCQITMMTFDSDDPTSCGIVETNDFGVVVAMHEKVVNPPGNRANAAIYLIEPEVLDWLAKNSNLNNFSTEVLPFFMGRIATWHNKGIFRDIGTLSELRAAQSDSLSHIYRFENDAWQKSFEDSGVFSFLMSNLSIFGSSNDR